MTRKQIIGKNYLMLFEYVCFPRPEGPKMAQKQVVLDSTKKVLQNNMGKA